MYLVWVWVWVMWMLMLLSHFYPHSLCGLLYTFVLLKQFFFHFASYFLVYSQTLSSVGCSICGKKRSNLYTMHVWDCPHFIYMSFQYHEQWVQYTYDTIYYHLLSLKLASRQVLCFYSLHFIFKKKDGLSSVCCRFYQNDIHTWKSQSLFSLLRTHLRDIFQCVLDIVCSSRNTSLFRSVVADAARK